MENSDCSRFEPKNADLTLLEFSLRPLVHRYSDYGWHYRLVQGSESYRNTYVNSMYSFAHSGYIKQLVSEGPP